MCRVAPAQHQRCGIGHQGIPEVIHQFPDADIPGEALSKFRMCKITHWEMRTRGIDQTGDKERRGL